MIPRLGRMGVVADSLDDFRSKLMFLKIIPTYSGVIPAYQFAFHRADRLRILVIKRYDFFKFMRPGRGEHHLAHVMQQTDDIVRIIIHQ